MATLQFTTNSNPNPKREKVLIQKFDSNITSIKILKSPLFAGRLLVFSQWCS